MDANAFTKIKSQLLDLEPTRTARFDDWVSVLINHWGYDLFARKPGAALTEAGLLVTDLDLACFMSALAERGAVINIPKYKGRRAATRTEGERILSKDNRHGKVTGLSANKEVFSFSVRIQDANVMQAATEDRPDQSGAPRNFMLVDVDGQWWDGWSKIEFMPTAKENAFLTDKKLWNGHTVVFREFVHPNRWISFYGRYYLLSKIAIERAELEVTHLGREIKRLESIGVTFPSSGGDGPREWPKSETVGEEEKIQVEAFEAEVGGYSFEGDFGQLAPNPEALRAGYQRRKSLLYTRIPLLRFATRATEMAFHKFGEGGQRKPVWALSDWERGVVLPKKRKVWSQIDLNGLQIRYRTYQKTETVAA